MRYIMFSFKSYPGLELVLNMMYFMLLHLHKLPSSGISSEHDVRHVLFYRLPSSGISSEHDVHHVRFYRLPSSGISSEHDVHHVLFSGYAGLVLVLNMMYIMWLHLHKSPSSGISSEHDVRHVTFFGTVSITT